MDAEVLPDRAGVSYPWPVPPAADEGIEVAPGVHWLRLPLPFKLDHINVWLLAGADGWTIVDTGLGTAAVQAVWERYFAFYLDGAPVARVVVTHHHPDHFGLAGWLARTQGAPVWMTPRAYARACYLLGELDAGARADLVDFYESHGLVVDDDFERVITGGGYQRIVAPAPERIEPLVDGTSVRLGRYDWTVVVVDGHAEGHAMLHNPELGLLIAGDQLLPAISPNVSVYSFNPEADPLDDFLRSLERIERNFGDARVLPSHGGVFDGAAARAATMRRHHAATCDRVLRFCRQPCNAASLVPRLFPIRLDPLNTMLAFGETLAHIRLLERRGRIEQHANRGVIHYRTIGDVDDHA